ncbi:MAG: ExbD/TolR family protein [Pseudomonadota bacterium]
MARRAFKKQGQALELDVTTFMNLMVVLIPFLLATAVFSQVSIQELNLPQAAAGGAVPDTPLVTIEVMVRKKGLEIGNGKAITDSIPMKEGKYDLARLSDELRNLKARYPDKQDVTVLLEPDIEYSDMIGVMDAVKADIDKVRGKPDQAVVLFPEISIGDTP